MLRIVFLLFITTGLFISCSDKRKGKPRILIFSKTAGYRHSSIGVGKEAIMKLGNENGFEVDTTENADYFNEDSLKKYAAVVFLHTTGDLLNNYQEADFERYIQAGGGYVGIHAASDAEYDWGWYGRLVGGYFESHPAQQQATLKVVNQTNISTKHLPKEWSRKDEWYNFKNLNPDVHVLIKIDEKSYEGGKNGDNHPMAWYHDFDGGRAWYTELGHTEESFKEENYLKHLLGGIQYAVGDNKKLDLDKATSLRVPEENRFTKNILKEGEFFEPTEMTILPNLDVLIAQRRGEILFYNHEKKSIKQAGFLNAYWKTEVKGVNAEEGILGLKADPNFDKNHFIYIFYSPADTSVNRLSRFKFENDTIVNSSEKIILQFYSQRNICCHTGGSIDFGPDGKTLFVSTGDNSTPFDEPGQKFVNSGFAPLNDAPGHEQYDARRSAGNTNDLRGKIIRIVLHDDGSYEIPGDNLFAKGTPDTRPEIYVMGNRNPYRIMVDKKNGFLYWGEVGPDASNDSLNTRGPKGYDEINQARKAGYFGWPLFVGNNYPYYEYDYLTGKSGTKMDAAKPVNSSKNNTGITDLPPAQPAFIWYPYGNSPDFPQVGSGGRNAMAGPVYYTDMFPKDTRLPEYYNKKLFIYDWIRGWIKVVAMKPNGDFDKMEPFMQNTKLNNLIDMEVGPDGKLYLLEYGSGWFSKNADAALSVIDYNAGNRPPKVENLQVDKTAGALPFKIKATVEALDPENDKLTYKWNVGNGKIVETTIPELVYTFDKAGDYNIAVIVSDDKKAETKSAIINVYAGNETPSVELLIKGNKTFYFPGKNIQYEVTINDKGDTSKPNPENLIVSADYVEGTDKAAASPGHKVLSEAMVGKNITQALDCKSCHKTTEKSIGPSFTDVALKYEKDPNAMPYLVNKIIKGGSGVWGEVKMAAHPDLLETDAKKIVTWIQTLGTEKRVVKSLPQKGSLNSTQNKPVKDNGILYVSATYTDNGGNNIKPLTGSSFIALRNSKLNFSRTKSMNGFTKAQVEEQPVLMTPLGTGWIKIDSIDLTGINAVAIQTLTANPLQFGYVFEIHLDSPEGELLATMELPKDGKQKAVLLKSSFKAPADGKFHNIFIVSKVNNAQEKMQAGLQWMQFIAE